MSEQRKMSFITTAFVIAAKSKKLLAVAKSAKLLQPLISFVSVGLSVFAYSFALGWAFSIAFVAMIMVHELGHVAALRQKKIKASLPIFIPFLGAAVFAPAMKRRHDEAYMAFAGPLIGSLAAFVLLAAVVVVPGRPEFLVLLVFTALFVNLFNLIPLSPLDGGRVTQAIGPWFKYVGVACLLGLTLLLRTPGILLIWVLVIADLRIDPLRKLQTGLGLQTVMMAMMLFGFGEDQSMWVDIVDIVLVSLFNLMFWFGRYEFEPTEDDRIPATLTERRGWLIAWVVLVVVLIYTLVEMTSLLPPGAVS